MATPAVGLAGRAPRGWRREPLTTQVGGLCLPWVPLGALHQAAGSVELTIQTQRSLLTRDVRRSLESLRGESLTWDGTGEGEILAQVCSYISEQHATWSNGEISESEEIPALRMHLAPTELAHALATDFVLDRPLVEKGGQAGPSLRQRCAEDLDLRKGPCPSFAHHLVLGVLVITSDEQAIARVREDELDDAECLGLSDQRWVHPAELSSELPSRAEKLLGSPNSQLLAASLLELGARPEVTGWHVGVESTTGACYLIATVKSERTAAEIVAQEGTPLRALPLSAIELAREISTSEEQFSPALLGALLTQSELRSPSGRLATKLNQAGVSGGELPEWARPRTRSGRATS